MKKGPRIITVCSECLRAGCWHGIFMCDDAQTASTVDRTTTELAALKKEHSSYYSVGEIRKHTGAEPRYVSDTPQARFAACAQFIQTTDENHE